MIMNWFRLINKATSYIENHISDKIVLEEIAKHCNVSYHYFSKTFGLITGYNLKEYIRNRRITLASYDISNTDERIIDIAFKYGYSSNEAFSRAFKKIHGINPSKARKNHITIYTHFPVLKYDIPKPNMISLRYEILDNLEFNFVGVTNYIIENDYQTTQDYQSDLVNQFKSENKLDKTLYRVHYNLSYDEMRYDYLIGFLKEEEESIKDLVELNVKVKKAIRFISKNTKEDIIPKIKTIIYDEWKKNDFLADSICEVEYFLRNDNETIDYYYIVSIL